MSEPSDATTLHTGEFLQLRRSGHWEYVRRVRGTGGAAFMVATTDADELILVEQWRVPANHQSIELPAGIVGDDTPDEQAHDAAVRELEEETGFYAAQVDLIHDAPTAGGLSSEWAWYYRMRQLTRLHAGGGVEAEDITTHLVPIATANAWLHQQRALGKVIDARIYAALYWLQQE